jgi:hypothetical protein
MGGPLALGRRFDTLPVVFAHQLVLLPLGRMALLYFGSRPRTRVRGGVFIAGGARRIRIILCASVFGPGRWSVRVVGGIGFRLRLLLTRTLVARTTAGDIVSAGIGLTGLRL